MEFRAPRYSSVHLARSPMAGQSASQPRQSVNLCYRRFIIIIVVLIIIIVIGRRLNTNVRIVATQRPPTKVQARD